MKTVGTLTLGTGTDRERTIQITDMLSCEFQGNRKATVAKDEEGNYLLSINNPASSGRQPETVMYLTEGSFMAILLTSHLFLSKKGIDLNEKMKEYSLDEDHTDFEYQFNEE